MSERVFTLGDQEAFAALSRDFNPMHVDPQAARRLQYGRPVVHGIHLVLWALDQWLAGRPEALGLEHLAVQFRAAICVGDTVALDWADDGNARTRITFRVGGHKTTEITATWITASPDPPGTLPRPETVPPPCVELAEEKLPTAAGAVPIALAEAERAAVLATPARLPARQVAVLLATSRLVGMECPGLHSVYSRLLLDFRLPDAPLRALAYRTRAYDSRFRFLRLAVEAPGVTGEIDAFVRRPPVSQPQIAALTALVPPHAFAGRRAVVIGGSRGLGETAAKLLAAGGAEVHITYATGIEDAQRVAAEITASGGRAAVSSLDVLDPDPACCARLRDRGPTDLYYFATPRIEPTQNRTFSGDLFLRLSRYYVQGFAVLFARLMQDDLARVFYPSTVFLDERSARFAEYIAAKAAGESLCASLAELYPAVMITFPRLPRLASDQTSAEEAPAAPVLADLLLSAGRTSGNGFVHE